MITAYHAKYYAHLLTQKSISGDIDSISQSLLSAAVDINPHQIEAALFAFSSPLSKGVILADEVGLGKTIEAGLVICQYWAIGKRKIIVVCPAALRKQWSMELSEKFGLDNEILDAKNFNSYIREGKNSFEQKKIIICSYNFAARKSLEIKRHGFELAVIDEAHKLRNVYKSSSKTAITIKETFSNVKKLLLTATPFQNSLMELYGLTSVIDEEIFGDKKTFRSEYINEENYSDLRKRLMAYYKRTLRNDVKEYINFTKRLPLTQKFDATDMEQELYKQVSEFLRKDNLYSVPFNQRMLTTMIVRKILASSTFALIGTLQTIKARLEKMLSDNTYEQINIEQLIDEDDFDVFDEYLDEEEQEQNPQDIKINIAALKEEIATIEKFISLAKQIKQDSKSEALLQALESAFDKLPDLGANKKALIFTESTRTQKYLHDFLSNYGYKNKITIFNGSNADAESNAIYDQWCKENAYNGKACGIKAADRRMAIVDYFKNSAEIMIATEAAAEGLNLQFCSLVVNYDLPWNPQRIEQRIGRCHRYGQKSDVVVVNFVNQRNYADTRVFDLLMDKFHLFNDIFGASDEILGQTDAMDFERRIYDIYQECRNEDEIALAFEKLQADMQAEIDERMNDIKNQVLENFDIDVQERLKLAKENTNAFLNRYQHIFWTLTKYILKDVADFNDSDFTFFLNEKIGETPKGKYDLTLQSLDGYPYRLSHPLAQYVLNKAFSLEAPQCTIIFSENSGTYNVSLPEHIKGQSGYMVMSKLSVTAFDEEQHTLFTAFTKDGIFLTQEECERLFLCGGVIQNNVDITSDILHKLEGNVKQHVKSTLSTIDNRNLIFFRAEEERIFRWEKDFVENLEKELDTIKRQIREYERLSRIAENMAEKLELTKKIEELERTKRKKRNELADKEDEIISHRKQQITDLEQRMIQQSHNKDIFVIGWKVK
jgi:ERCC4-related helicase